MKTRGVHLQYSFEATEQPGAAVGNPLFELLQAVHASGSIQGAAAAVGASYRHVWGALKRWQDVLGEPLVNWSQGNPARLTPFAERLLKAETLARARLAPHIEALRAELEQVLAEALDGSQPVLTVCASHDPALALLRSTARAGEGLHIDLRCTGSLDALRALAEGRCSLAGLYLPELPAGGAAPYAQVLKPLLKSGRHSLIGCTRRIQGLMVPPGNPQRLHALPDVVTRRARFVQRQAGSATRLLTEHLLLQAQTDPQHLALGPTEDSHAAAAAAVAAGLGDTGMGTEAAARACGLDFVPLASEDGYLVCHSDALDEPAVQGLRRVLRGPGWQQAVAALPGHAPWQPGEVQTLHRALPWWRTAKARTV